MKKYRFPLEAVQRVRKLQRDEQQLRLVDAYRAEEIVRNRLQTLMIEIVAAQEHQREAACEEQLDVNRLVAVQRYELSLQSQQQTLHEQATLLAEEAERRQQAAIEAERAVRAMEKLDHRLRAAHRIEERRDEAKQLDEVMHHRVATQRR